MSTIRFLMLGGFLGAGKTTTIARLARHYQSQGQKVGIVTNDQATDLVDTNSLRAQGFDVGEVAGACFCCNFNELTETVGQLEKSARPDVVLAEPVGSCTDLVATVVRPLQQLFRRHVRRRPPTPCSSSRATAAASCAAKPRAASRRRRPTSSRSSSKRPTSSSSTASTSCPAAKPTSSRTCSQTQYPGTPVLRMSAKTGAGFDALVEFARPARPLRPRLMDIDYDIYADGEAELGWLNSSLTRLGAASRSTLDELLLDIISRLQASLAEIDAEAAHLKAIGLADGLYGVANLVSSFSPPSCRCRRGPGHARPQLVVNARVAIDPETLTEHVERPSAPPAPPAARTPTFQQTQSFRPGRPVPTHRILEPTA